MAMMKKLNIICAGTSEGSANYGCETAPEIILQSGLETMLNRADWELKVSHVPAVDEDGRYHDIPLHNATTLIPWLRELYRQIGATTSYDERVLVLGGDHSIGASSLLATKQRYPDAVCIYIDAHPDAHTTETTQTNNLHGLPLRIATGQTLTKEFVGPYYKPQEVFLVGIKDIDLAEAQWLKEHNIAHRTMDDNIEQGIGTIMREVIKWVGDRPVHISFDIDSIDAMFAPGTGIQNMGGFTYREAEYIARKLSTLEPVAIDMVEVNPLRDLDGKTVLLAQELSMKLLGEEWSAYHNYLHSSVQ